MPKSKDSETPSPISKKGSRTSRKSAKRLTEKQHKFLDNKLAGMNDRQAALQAGYSPKDPDGAARQVKNAVEANVYEALGIRRDQFIRKYLGSALEAKETKAFSNDGRIIYSKPMVAWQPRLRALDIAMLMAGEYKAEQRNETKVQVIVVNGAHRPPNGNNGNGAHE